MTSPAPSRLSARPPRDAGPATAAGSPTPVAVASYRVRILTGDCRDVLKTLPDESVHCVVTSPPYFGLRDYGVAGQIGLEPTPDAYVAEMVAVFREVRRVLRSDGTVWLVLGDSYAGSWGNYGGQNRGKGDSQRPIVNGSKAHQRAYDGLEKWRPATSNKLVGIKPKDLIGIPWAVAFALRADGWWLRQDNIWSKPNPMPESVRDRCTKAHETIFLLTKSPRYYFDAAAISERVSEPRIVQGSNLPNERSVLGQNGCFQEAATMASGATPLISACDSSRAFKIGIRLAASILDIAEAKHDFSLLAFDPQVRKQRADELARALIVHHPVVRRASSEAARFADGDITAEQFLHKIHGFWIALPDGDDLKEAWRVEIAGFPFVNANGDRAVRVNNASEISKFECVHNEQDTTTGLLSRKKNSGSYSADSGRHDSNPHPSGGYVTGTGTRNRRSVWTIATQPYSEAHFATFPPDLVEPCIKAGCPAGGTCLDPFFGAGTTGLVADRLQRNCIGIELNPEYVALAERRIRGDAPLFAGAAE